jgi:hypothetical protein
VDTLLHLAAAAWRSNPAAALELPSIDFTGELKKLNPYLEVAEGGGEVQIIIADDRGLTGMDCNRLNRYEWTWVGAYESHPNQDEILMRFQRRYEVDWTFATRFLDYVYQFKFVLFNPLTKAYTAVLEIGHLLEETLWDANALQVGN